MTSFAFRQMRSGRAAILNYRLTQLIHDGTFPDGVSILAEVIGRHGEQRTLTLAWGLTPTVADIVLDLIKKAVRTATPLSDMDDLVRTAERIEAAGIFTIAEADA